MLAAEGISTTLTESLKRYSLPT